MSRRCAATTIWKGEVKTCDRDHSDNVAPNSHSAATGGALRISWSSSAEFDEGVRPIDEIKARWDLIPWDQLASVERVLTHGLDKHGSEFGWKERTRAEHVQALLRHAVEYARGKRFDEETKQPVLAHVVARALFVMFHDGEVLP